MKNILKSGGLLICAIAMTIAMNMPVQAAGQETVKSGIYAENIDLSGKNVVEIKAAVELYIHDLEPAQITLVACGDKEVTVTALDLGVKWANTDLPQKALAYGTEGNIIERYKVLKDLEHESYVFPIELEFDQEAIRTVLDEKCAKYNQKAQNVSLKREADGTFLVEEGKEGLVLDAEASLDMVYNFLTKEWDHADCRIPLTIVKEEPRGNADELSEVRDVLGSFTTSYTTSGTSRSANVENGCRLINGITLYPGEEFSTYQTVAPFSKDNGYYMAGSYMNGKVVDSIGGGICQVSTTLYNAVLKAELEVTERHNHSMIVSYVEPSADAAIAESAGKDFKFVNNLDYPIYIEGYTKDKRITFNIYGKEVRDANRSVSYESEVLQVIHPETETIYADASKPIGYVVTESAHTGYKARLWKVVKENGEEKREQINSSNYKMTPRCATVGVATSDPNAYNEIMAAIGTSNIDHVKNVAASLAAAAAEQQ